MTTTAEGRPRITRPGGSVDVDPKKVRVMRNRRRLTRSALSARITALGAVNEHGRPVSLGKDAIGKIETGARNPSEASFDALCEVLRCEPADLMPGGAETELPAWAREQEERLELQRELRDFALAEGLRYKNPGNGRVYYGQRLREAYDRYLDLAEAAGRGDPDAEAEARAAYSRALARAPRIAGGEAVPEQRAS